MRITCDNPHHDAGEGVCVFCVNDRIKKAVSAAISDYRIAALHSVLHDETMHEIVKSALDTAEDLRTK